MSVEFKKNLPPNHAIHCRSVPPNRRRKWLSATSIGFGIKRPTRYKRNFRTEEAPSANWFLWWSIVGTSPGRSHQLRGLHTLLAGHLDWLHKQTSTKIVLWPKADRCVWVWAWKLSHKWKCLRAWKWFSSRCFWLLQWPWLFRCRQEQPEAFRKALVAPCGPRKVRPIPGCVKFGRWETSTSWWFFVFFVWDHPKRCGEPQLGGLFWMNHLQFLWYCSISHNHSQS